MSKPESSQRINAKVGLFILIGIIILATAILTLGTMRKSFITRIDASATFEEVNGLTKGNNVWYSGVKVGTVREIDFTSDSKVKVIFSIEDKSQQFIKKDATVRVSSDGLIGNPIILISGGSANVPMIEDGHEFKIEKEESTQEMLKTLQANNKNILSITENLKAIVAGINSGQGSVGKLLKDEAIYANLTKSLATVEAATRDLKNGASSLATLTQKLNAEGNFVNSIATDKEMYPAIKNTIETLQTTTDNLKASSLAAKQMVSNLEQTSKTIDNMTSNTTSPIGVLLHDEKTAKNIKGTIENLESSTAKLDQNMEALKHNIFFRRYFKNQAKEAEKNVIKE